MENILTVKELNKIYAIGKGQSQHILKDIEFSIRQGEFVSIMGPSGSGKSTLLYNISGMDRPTTGSVVFNGKEITAMGEDCLAEQRLCSMGFIFQQSNLLKNLNIMDNIILSAYLAKGESRQAINKRAEALMKRTGIWELKDKDITQVSGGQLQRGAVCRALINQPKIIFGDEPTGALNSKATEEVMDILADINEEGTTVLLVTHDTAVAARSERVLFISDGVLTGEKYMGKFDKTKENRKARETKLGLWLEEMGF